jgi:carbohydrate-selective porin OprB
VTALATIARLRLVAARLSRGELATDDGRWLAGILQDYLTRAPDEGVTLDDVFGLAVAPSRNALQCGRAAAMTRTGDAAHATAAISLRQHVAQVGAAFTMRNLSGKARRGEVCEGRFCSRSCAMRWRSRQPLLLGQGDMFREAMS